MPTKISIQKIQTAIDKALHFIQKEQHQGSFASTTSINHALPNTSTQKHTVFYTALISSVLKNINTEIAQNIKGYATDFLLKERSDDWSFNYWQKGSPDTLQSHYPNDLDDTFLSLHGIIAYRHDILDEKVWHSVANLLIENEAAESGPYYTWILPKEKRTDEWQDIDIVTNSNIALFLAEQNIFLPGLQYFFDQCIKNGRLESLYYQDLYIVIYFLAKTYNGKYSENLRKMLLDMRNTDGYWDNALQNACCISALLRLGEDYGNLSPAVKELVKIKKYSQEQTIPLFIEGRKHNTIFYSSCSSIIPACCAEALALFAEKQNEQYIKNQLEEAFIKNVKDSTKERFKQTSVLLRKQFVDMLNSLQIKDPWNEIILLPYNMHRNMDQIVPPEVSFQLARANVFGWIGYGIKDKILDNEASTSLLPCAIICIREAVRIFKKHATANISIRDIRDILDTIEMSLAWENKQVSLTKKTHGFVIPKNMPDYGDHSILAQKSFGHAIGPLILSSYSKNKIQTGLLKDFFIHYLTAKQLNDDAHDWLKDLQGGFLNSASVKVLQRWRGKFQRNIIDIQMNEDVLQELFWEYCIDEISSDILAHTAQARMLLQKITILRNSDFLEKYIASLERSAVEAVAERDKVMRFITQLQ